MSRIKEIREFWPAQKRFFEAGPAPFMFMGGVGSGKTVIGILKMLYLLDQYPGARGAIVRQRFSQLKRTTAATLWQLLDPRHIARRNDNEGIIRLKNGSEILLVHLDKPDSIDNLKSLEISFAYLDQAEDVSAEAFDVLVERVGRWTGGSMKGGWPSDWAYKTELGECLPPPYVFLSAYSPGWDNWITARFWEEGAEREHYRKQGYRYVVGSTRENKALTKQYIKGRLSMGKEYVERYVDASTWGANEGRIFTLDDLSLLEPDPSLLNRILHRMRLHRVYDHGEFSPSACLWYATDHDNNIFFYREYMKEGLLVNQHRHNIYEYSRDDSGGGSPPSYYSNLADPHIFDKTRGRTLDSAPSWSVADEFSDTRVQDPQTAIRWRPADNNEEMTISRMRQYLWVDPNHRHPLSGEMGAPRAYFIRRTPAYPRGCHEVLVDIRSAKRVEVGIAPDGSKQYGDERDEKVRDHLLDDVRYAIGARPALGMRPAEPPIKDGHISLREYEKATEERDRMKEKMERVGFRGHSSYGY